MRVCISRSALGTQESLIINSDGTLEWGQGQECDACLFNTESCAVPFEHLASMSGRDAASLRVAPIEQVSAFSSLGVDPDKVPWMHALGRDQFKRQLSGVSQTIQDVLRDHLLVEYVKTYRQCREFLGGLSRPTIDVSRLRSHVSECDSGLSVIKSIKSFTPHSDGLAPPVVYDQVRSSTGRLTVESGPSILTLPKTCRDMIRSDRGNIYEVDFVSLEPRFVLHVMGRQAPRDIYEDIRTRVFEGSLERRVVKTATISALYGSSAQLVSELTGITSSARTIIRRVKEYFNAEALGQRLSDESKSGTLHNYYGRPLVEMRAGTKESLLISHYVQSSCVDTALLGFSKLSSSLKTLGVRPIYVIHDAVIFDVPSESEEKFVQECAQGVSLDVGHFELSVSKTS